MFANQQVFEWLLLKNCVQLICFKRCSGVLSNVSQETKMGNTGSRSNKSSRSYSYSKLAEEEEKEEEQQRWFAERKRLDEENEKEKEKKKANKCKSFVNFLIQF